MSNPFTKDTATTVLSVSQLNRQVKTLLDSHFDFVWVEGEISNFAAPGSGHWYFSLKDGNSQVRCAMFSRSNQRVRFTPCNGDAVRVRCRVSLYEARGEYQLIAEHLEHAGAGALQIAFEKLKARLQAEGLFEAGLKQELPETVRHIGVITSPTGAVIHDVLHVLERRSPGTRVSVIPVAVQGDGAAAQISSALETANRWQQEGKVDLDALIVGRGGGSLEDLWAFNEEVVARAIVASDIPVVSAVGHEVDFSIADMVADVRAPTPSAAAEILSTDQREWLERLQGLQAALARQISYKLAETSSTLEHLSRRLRHPGAMLRENAQRLDDLEQQLISAQKNRLLRHSSTLAILNSQLQACSPAARLEQARGTTLLLRQQLERIMGQRLRSQGERLAYLGQMLDSLSPLGVLQRGYALVTNSEGGVVRDAGQVAVGDRVKARLAQGQLSLTVESKQDSSE